MITIDVDCKYVRDRYVYLRHTVSESEILREWTFTFSSLLYSLHWRPDC